MPTDPAPFHRSKSDVVVPLPTGMHEALSWAQAEAKLRDAYAELLLHPGAEAALQANAQHALQVLHLLNVARFGWRDAEVLRAQAFTWAVDNTIPVGDAFESSALWPLPRFTSADTEPFDPDHHGG